MKNHRMITIALIHPLVVIQALTLPKFDIQQPLIHQQYIVSSDLSIPGDSSVKHCADPTNNLFEIERLDVLPNPPQRGQSCIIEIEGVFVEEVGQNPMFMLNATYDSIHSIDTVEKLCDHVDIVQEEALVCPPHRGRAMISYTFFIHELMTPPGNYTQRVDAFNKDGERLFCVTSTTIFEKLASTQP